MFEEGEETHCPICGVELTSFSKLPPSPNVHDPAEPPLAPEQELLPSTYMGRGKGTLGLVGLTGLVLFFQPWLHMSLPYELTITGFDLARTRLGWVWAVGVAWMVLVPTVLSRRSILQMRGARFAAAFLGAIPGLTVSILLARPPKGGLIPVRFEYGWALWATLVVSLLAIALAVRLGGPVDDIKVSRGSSKGHELH
jgi:hypothetical protein